MKRILTALMGLCLFVPTMVWGQTSGPVKKYWTQTIELKDRRDDGFTPVVAKVTFAAYSMTEPTSPGIPVLGIEENGVLRGEKIKFPGLEVGYIKFKITAIDWSPMGKEYDGSGDYKVIVRNVWVDMNPKIYIETKKKQTVNLRKRYINAPNVEYVKGDSLPPPTIFKVDRNSEYTFTVGVKALTPKTTVETPFEFNFKFGVEGLVKSAVVDTQPIIQIPTGPIDTGPKKPVVETVNAEIDEAIKRAIEEENVETLMDLMRQYPQLESAKNARQYLALKMTKELVDSSTYRVDISYARFTRASPTKDDLNLVYSHFGQPVGEGVVNPVWRDGKLYIRPPKDSTDYTVTAIHRFTPENKASITLNSVRDNITFTYEEVAEEKVKFRVKGGHGPYTMFIQRLSGVDFFAMEGSMTLVGDTTLDKEFIARAYKLSEEADYRFFLVDAENLKKTGSGTVHIVPPPPIPPIVWYIALGFLVLFFIIFLFYRREKRRKDEELERLLAARGGSDPRVKRKPKPELEEFWKETAISELSLHKNFVRDVSTYLKERPHFNHSPDKPLVEGVLLGTVLKFDFENEQYEVRLDRFRALEPKPLDYYEERGDDDKWAAIREVTQDHRDLVKIGWLQVVDTKADAPLVTRLDKRLTKLEQQFQDEQFSELFQLMLKIDISGDERICGFFTRTTSGKINDVNDRLEGIDYWVNWDALEDAGYYDSNPKGVRKEGDSKIKVKVKGKETV